jgi:hypothetical protein
LRFIDKLQAVYRPFQAVIDGARLQSIGEQIWVADRELCFAAGVRLPIRMVVMGNRAGDLVCYSPVALDEATVEALAGIGEVRWIVVPNRHHGLFAREYQQHFPAARTLAVTPVPGCAARVLRSPAQIGPGFEALIVKLSIDFQELVIYHDRSETLVVSDLLLNIRAGNRRLEWLLRLNGAWRRAGHSRLQRLLLMRDRQGLAEFYRWALAQPFVQISMSHGQVIQADAREVFYQVFHRYVAGLG